jgi:hypothetical protein
MLQYIEKLRALAQQINILTLTYKMIDIWRRFHADSKQFTYEAIKQLTQNPGWIEYIFLKTGSSKQTPLRYAHTLRITQNCL